MAKKDNTRKKNLNVRITEAQEARWANYMEANRFSSLSALIRYCVDEFVEGTVSKSNVNNKNNKVKAQINELTKKYDDLMDSQKDILKLIAKKVEKPTGNLREYQKGIIINLLTESPMDEIDLSKIMPDLKEVEILAILNELLETSIIIQEKNKYKAI